MTDICIENRTLGTLKEDIGYFRNICQHANMNLLENVIKNFRNKAENIV